jgi:hypothetical protein
VPDGILHVVRDALVIIKRVEQSGMMHRPCHGKVAPPGASSHTAPVMQPQRHDADPIATGSSESDAGSSESDAGSSESATSL